MKFILTLLIFLLPSKASGDLGVPEIDRLIQKMAARYAINPQLIRAVVLVESNYDPRALSSKGAIGLMQLMPKTAAELGVRNPWDPKENLEGGILYLARLLWEFRDAKKALIAYNAGPRVVRKKLAVPRETRRYVDLVLGYFDRPLELRKQINKR